jgi:hypothetical protein
MNFPYDAKPGVRPRSGARIEAGRPRAVAPRAPYPSRPLPVPAPREAPRGNGTLQRSAVSSRMAVARPSAQRPVAMREEAFRGRPPARRWPLWLAMILTSSALVVAGYLAALVQVGARHTFVPRLISESPPTAPATPHASVLSSASVAAVSDAPNATNTTNVTGQNRPGATMASPTAKPHTAPRAQAQPAPARVRIGSARKVARAAVQPSTVRSAELYSEQRPVMTLHRLAEDEAAPSAAAQSTRDQPSREDVRRGLEQVRPQLSACAGGRHGAIDAQVTISGAGRVNYSVISGDFVGTPEGSCMARALRTATFPPFASTRFKVLYPFVL